jgi:hypothetical protein
LPVCEAILPEDSDSPHFQKWTLSFCVLFSMVVWNNALWLWSTDKRRIFLEDAVLACSLPILVLDVLRVEDSSHLAFILQIVALIGWYDYRIGLPLRPSEIVVVVMLASMLVVGVPSSIFMLVTQATPYETFAHWTAYMESKDWAVWLIVTCTGLWIQWDTRTAVRLLVEMLAVIWTSCMVTTLVAIEITELADAIGIFKPEFIAQLKLSEYGLALLMWALVVVKWYYHLLPPIFPAKPGN